MALLFVTFYNGSIMSNVYKQDSISLEIISRVSRPKLKATLTPALTGGVTLGKLFNLFVPIFLVYKLGVMALSGD